MSLRQAGLDVTLWIRIMDIFAGIRVQQQEDLDTLALKVHELIEEIDHKVYSNSLIQQVV